jgi:hypothetical protein
VAAGLFLRSRRPAPDPAGPPVAAGTG